MKYKISICDDMDYFVDDLKKKVQEFADKKNIPIEVDTFTDSKEFLTSFVVMKYQVVFLDIEMPGLDGIEIGKQIRGMNQDVLIIYITSHEGFAFQATQIESIGYLIKPVEDEKLYRMMRTVFATLEGLNSNKVVREEKIQLCIDYETEFIRVSEIVAFEKYRNKCVVYLSDGKTKECYETIKNLVERLPNEVFYQVGAGLLINISYVTYMKSYEVRFLTGKDEIIRRLGRKFYKGFNEAYLRKCLLE